MRRARSGNLTALLVAVAVLEFFINRLAGRLFFPRPTLATGLARVFVRRCRELGLVRYDADGARALRSHRGTS